MSGSKKALLVTTVSGFVPQFEMNNVRLLQERGYEVHYASNFDMPSYGDNNDRLKGTGIRCHQIAFAREPWNRKNMSAVRELTALIRREGVRLLHCHTPMGAACARLAAARAGLHNVIYTAHGFHFFDGAPKKNWLIYYPVEKFLSRQEKILSPPHRPPAGRRHRHRSGTARQCGKRRAPGRTRHRPRKAGAVNGRRNDTAEKSGAAPRSLAASRRSHVIAGHPGTRKIARRIKGESQGARRGTAGAIPRLPHGCVPLLRDGGFIPIPLVAGGAAGRGHGSDGGRTAGSCLRCARKPGFNTAR